MAFLLGSSPAPATSSFRSMKSDTVFDAASHHTLRFDPRGIDLLHCRNSGPFQQAAAIWGRGGTPARTVSGGSVPAAIIRAFPELFPSHRPRLAPPFHVQEDAS